MVLYKSFLKLNVLNNFEIMCIKIKWVFWFLIKYNVYDFIFIGNFRGYRNGIYKRRSGILGF